LGVVFSKTLQMKRKDIQKGKFYIFRYRHQPENGFVVQASSDNTDTFKEHIVIKNNIPVHYSYCSGALTIDDQVEECHDLKFIETLKLSRAQRKLVISKGIDEYEIY
jgi:hypothetical protein